MNNELITLASQAVELYIISLTFLTSLQIVLLECKSIVCAGFQAELHLHNFSGNVEFTVCN